MREERDMAEQLMTYVGLWRVEGIRVVPDVLRGPEHAEGERVEEVPCRQQALYRPDLKASLCVEELVDLLQLRDPRSREDAVAVELCHRPLEVLTGMLALHSLEPVVDCPPGLVLLLRVVHGRDGLAKGMAPRVLDDGASPLLVRLVVEARMVLIDQRRAAVQGLASLVQIPEGCWEPRHAPRRQVGDLRDERQLAELADALLRGLVVDRALDVELERGVPEAVLVQPRLHVGQAQAVLVECLQHREN
mmetsp:Transcript_49915/g.120207  ORF Transcript_49915/g.120207 Transcript_49915/m.120207 type:complete len:248 (+) Transcript_49915:626-1369(+)